MMQDDTVYYTPERQTNEEAARPPAEVGPLRPGLLPASAEKVQPLAGGRWISLFFVLALIIVVGGSVPAGMAVAYYGDFIMPGVTVLESDIGGQSLANATQTLNDDWDARQIVLQGENHSLTVAPATLGITLDAAATARNARLLGREGESLEALASVYMHGASSQPVWQIDLAATSINLDSYAYLYDVPAQDAQLTFAEGALLLEPAATGQRLDIERMTAWLGSNSAQAVLEGQAPLLLATTQPAVTEATLQPLLGRTQAWLNQPLTLRLYDPVSNETNFVEIRPESWNRWVTLDVDIHSDEPIQASVQTELINGFLPAV